MKFLATSFRYSKAVLSFLLEFVNKRAHFLKGKAQSSLSFYGCTISLIGLSMKSSTISFDFILVNCITH